MFEGNRYLNSARFKTLIQDQNARYQQAFPLRFLDRTPTVNAEDDEIVGSYTGRVYAADIIADDQAAAVYEGGSFVISTNAIPNIKRGQKFGQAQLNRLGRLARGNGGADDARIFADWEAQTARDLLLSVRMTMNALICAMQIDAFNYDRLGIKLAGVTWGMPAAYKANFSTIWSNPAATPVTDILVLKDYAAETDGQVFDRVTLSSTSFRYMIATTEFKELISGRLGVDIGTTAFNSRQPRMREFAADILGMTIEIEDATVPRQAPDGLRLTDRVLPVNKAILSSTADDNNGTSMDFANGIVTESVVAGIVGGYDGLGGEQFGPVGYYTGPPDLNPPTVIGWGVARGFPRKHNKYATAVLTTH